jgi:hypothetical protein
VVPGPAAAWLGGLRKLKYAAAHLGCRVPRPPRWPYRLRRAGFCYLAALAFFSLGSSELVVFTSSSANFRWLARICSMKS